MAARIAGLGLAVALLGMAAAWAAEEYPGFAWMADSSEGNAYVTYGSTETGEDYLFNLFCGADKSSVMSVYVDIVGTKVGDPVTLDFKSGDATLVVPGRIGTDEMSGFLFAEATGFKVKPVVALLGGKGPVTVKTGSVLTTLPEKGRAKTTAEFAKSCPLD
ncbi:MAG: hypothetical protein ACRECX_09910 [Methyloceanibacter sp.]|uniref:hypothetical protein n=1 Tax=Methyloceanibacter sp. TaxID=1965321 RepID=UPI003D6D7B81